MDKGMSLAGAKENMENQEVQYVKMAEDFFKKSLDPQNQDKAATQFGKGLACLLFIYKKRAWYSHFSLLKSFFYGVRPMGRAIEKFMEVSPKNPEQAGEKFNSMLNTLYLTVFRNHKIEAFKSVLETSNLKKILSGISETGKDVESKLEKQFKSLEEKITKNEFQDRVSNAGYSIAVDFAETGGTFFLLPLLIITIPAGLSLMLFGSVCYHLTMIYNIIAVGFRKLTGCTRRATTLEFLKNEKKKLYESINKNCKNFISDVQNGIKDELNNLEKNYNISKNITLEK